MIFFVAGITGHVGGAAAQRLHDEGHTVRALVRDPQRAAAWSAKGVEVRQGDFNDPSAVAGALEGVDGAFLMVPPIIAPAPGYPESKATIASLKEAVGTVTPPRVVVLSSIGSEKTSGLGLITVTHLLEEALGDLPVPTAFLRAGGFFENDLAQVAGAAHTGVFYSFLAPTDRATPMVATADIGAEVARLLLGGWSGKKIIELGSMVSPDDVARAMGEAMGQPVVAQAIPREHWTATIESFGIPAGRTGAFEEMEEGMNSGWIGFGVPGTEAVPGTTTPAQFFAKAKQA